MDEFCFVIETVEWDEERDGRVPGSEVSEIVRVFRDEGDVIAYVEENASANYPDFEFRWHGGRKYSACSKEYGSGWREGVAYIVHYVPLC